MGVVHDAVEVERHGAQGSVVGVGEGIDDGVERVAAHNVVFVFYSAVSRLMIGRFRWVDDVDKEGTNWLH